MKVKHLPYLFLLTISVSCSHHVDPEMTQLEVRQQETKTYETSNQKLVMKSVLNVLQDEGFIVKNIVFDLGFVMATKDVDIESPHSRFFATTNHGKYASWDKAKLIEVTVNVSEFGNKTRVRANFQQKILDNRGLLVTIKPIRSDEFYQEFFSKVHKGIFIDENEI